MSQRITIEIKNKIATCLTELPVVCGNADYVVDFAFDEEWDAHEIKTAIFVVNGKAIEQVFAGNVCPIPVIQNTLIAWVGVFAGTINDGTLSTSTPALVKCIPCITDGDKVPAPPPDDVYNQIIDLINSGLLRGPQGEKGEKGDKGDAGAVKFIPVAELPTENIETDAIYLVPVEDSDEENSFTEYAYIDGKWELLGAISIQVDHSEYVKFTDFAQNNKAGVTISADDSALMNEKRGINGEYPYVPSTRLSFAVKRGLINGKGNWTEDTTNEKGELVKGEKTIARETVGAVGFTDYATADKAGVIKLGAGLSVSPSTNSVFVKGATNAQIDAKATSYYPIAPSTLDRAVKVGITTNTETLTDEEKGYACEWLGAIPKQKGVTGLSSAVVQKPPAVGGYESIALSTYANQALYGRIPRYQNPAWEGDVPADNMGMLVTNYPTKKYHCANKGWVEDLVGIAKTEYQHTFINGYSNKSCQVKIYNQRNQLNIIIAGQLDINPSEFVSGTVQTFLEFTLDEETSRKLFVGESNVVAGNIVATPGTYYNDQDYRTTVVPFILRRKEDGGNNYLIRFTDSGLVNGSTLTDVNWRISLPLE